MGVQELEKCEMLQAAEPLDACLVDLDNDAPALDPEAPAQGATGGPVDGAGGEQRHAEGSSPWKEGALGAHHFSRLRELLSKVCLGPSSRSPSCCESSSVPLPVVPLPVVKESFSRAPSCHVSFQLGGLNPPCPPSQCTLTVSCPPIVAFLRQLGRSREGSASSSGSTGPTAFPLGSYLASGPVFWIHNLVALIQQVGDQGAPSIPGPAASPAPEFTRTKGVMALVFSCMLWAVVAPFCLCGRPLQKQGWLHAPCHAGSDPGLPVCALCSRPMCKSRAGQSAGGGAHRCGASSLCTTATTGTPLPCPPTWSQPQ